MWLWKTNIDASRTKSFQTNKKHLMCQWSLGFSSQENTYKYLTVKKLVHKILAVQASVGKVTMKT